MSTQDESGVVLNRRGFIKGFASAAAAAALVGPGPVLAGQSSAPGQFGRALLAPPVIDATPGTKKFWKKVRKAFSLPDDYIHMNTGTTGSQPEFVQNNLAVYNRYKSADPRDWTANLAADFPTLFPVTPSATGARQAQVAAAYGANPDEIVLSYNTTDACNLIFAGTPWKAGDRIVTTSFEHNALVGAIAWARDYHKVEVVVIDIPSHFDASITVDQVVDQFETALAEPLPSGNKQYLAISEVFYKNGVRMPIKELCDAAHRKNAFTIIDAAHGWGMLPVDCHGCGADFIAGAGHKWLCGGPGTGIFYCRRSYDNGFPLPPFAMGNFFGYGNLFVDPSVNYNSRGFSPASSIQSRGEVNTPALYAMTDSLAFFTQIGLDAIYEQGVALGNYLKGLIADQWGPEALWVQENPDTRFATALTAFNPFADRDYPSKFAAMSAAINGTGSGASRVPGILDYLAQETPKIYVRSITWRSSQQASADDRIGFRISTHAVYNNMDEVDHVFARLVERINMTGLPVG
jgi:isopenicillin-N epimerase